jgi:hypothetical protein
LKQSIVIIVNLMGGGGRERGVFGRSIKSLNITLELSISSISQLILEILTQKYK